MQEATSVRKLRYCMIGGGPDAFIGAVHRMAAALDGGMELVGGAFSSDPDKSARQGQELFLDPDRVHGSWERMIEREAALPEERRADFISIVTPNHLHHPVAKAALEAGFHIVCDKPMTNTLEEAEDLCRRVSASGQVFALTHNYTGYPMVKQARALVRAGHLGTLRKVVVEYPQGWLSTPLENTGQKQAAWRTDPARAGISSALGDIGTHCENLVQYVTGLVPVELFADLSTIVPGRKLEDDASVLLRYPDGARGLLYVSQISTGEENALKLRVYGTDAGLDWRQETPNELRILYPDRPEEIHRRGNDYLSAKGLSGTRLPAGHPEGFIEAFANIYVEAGRAMRGASDADHPGVAAGARGVHFIHTAVRSSRERAWVDAAYKPPA